MMLLDVAIAAAALAGSAASTYAIYAAGERIAGRKTGEIAEITKIFRRCNSTIHTTFRRRSELFQEKRDAAHCPADRIV